MRQIVIAADPVHRREFANLPPVAFVLARVVKSFRFSSKLTPSRSLPHSIPIIAGPSPFKGPVLRGNFCIVLSRCTYASEPWMAVNSSPKNGLKTTPTVGFLSTTSPMDMQTAGMSWTKSEVPSIGSRMNVGSFVITVPRRYVPSPTKSKAGYCAFNPVDMSASTALSVSVTMSAAAVCEQCGCWP